MISTSWAATKAQAEQQRTIHRILTIDEIEEICNRAHLASLDLNRLEYVRQLALSGKIEG